MSDKPTLEEIKFSFSQEGNCIDSKSDEYETLEVKVRSSLGIDYDNGGFITLKTKQWAINDISEITELLQRVQDSLNGALINNPHKK